MANNAHKISGGLIFNLRVLETSASSVNVFINIWNTDQPHLSLLLGSSFENMFFLCVK